METPQKIQLKIDSGKIRDTGYYGDARIKMLYDHLSSHCTQLQGSFEIIGSIGIIEVDLLCEIIVHTQRLVEFFKSKEIYY